MLKKIRAMTCFRGAGGSSYGAQKAGVRLLRCLICGNKQLKFFTANFPNATVFSSCYSKTFSRCRCENKIGNIELILAYLNVTSLSIAKVLLNHLMTLLETQLLKLCVLRKFTKPSGLVIENV